MLPRRGRETMSAPRRQAVKRCAIWMSRASPAAWPRLSLKTLNSSMSMNSTANLKSVCRRERVIARCNRSRKSARFGRLVKPSWKDWWASFSSARFRWVMSRFTMTSPSRLAFGRREWRWRWTQQNARNRLYGGCDIRAVPPGRCCELSPRPRARARNRQDGSDPSRKLPPIPRGHTPESF